MRQAASPSARRASPRIIERPRLIRALEDATARTILVIAPAGYGKTTFARQWANHHPGVRWYTARTGSADVAQLAVDLAAVLDEQPPKLREFVSQLVRARSSPTQQVAEILDGFAGAVGDASSASVLIDDYHVLAAEPVAERFVHELQTRLGFRLFVASRSRPTWATARLQIYGETIELGLEELALTDEEATQLLGKSVRSRGLLEQARGWPAVVGLAAQTETVNSPPESGASTLFRFFAEELFLATPSEIQDKLITLALLPTLAPQMADRALGDSSVGLIAEAAESGLVTQSAGCSELHPLVREYLLTKLQGRDDVSERVKAAIQLSFADEQWDHSFDLIERFDVLELLGELVERSFKPLLTSGRIATLARITRFARKTPGNEGGLIDLVDAELAFRAGSFSQTQAIATRAARGLGPDHRLTSHAWWIAGQAAQLSFDDDGATHHFEHAQATAQDDGSRTDALWGLTMTLAQAERPSLTDVLAQFAQRRAISTVDLVRGTQAELLARRATNLVHPVDVAEAIYALDSLTDPRITTSFMNTYAYHLILSGRYDEAQATASTMRRVAEGYQLKWAQPHAHWALAASALGLRDFRKAEGWLRRVEISADEQRYGQLLLNAACLRARLLMALQRPQEALLALSVDETQAASRAMQGEFLATRALAVAITAGPPAEVTGLAKAATELTTCVEARAYSACAAAVVGLTKENSVEAALVHLADAQRLGVWDAVVATLRAVPELLAAAASQGQVDGFLAQALRRANDHDLARRAGIELGRRTRLANVGGVLSPRESEVFELVRQGLTNGQIARTLFLSEATVKAHVRQILNKTGTRTRTEAATSTDFDLAS